jgi:hypothetical protein
LNIFFIGQQGGKSIFANIVLKNEKETDLVALQLMFHEVTSEFNLSLGVMVDVHCEDNVFMISLTISISESSSGMLWCQNIVKTA